MGPETVYARQPAYAEPIVPLYRQTLAKKKELGYVALRPPPRDGAWASPSLLVRGLPKPYELGFRPFGGNA